MLANTPIHGTIMSLTNYTELKTAVGSWLGRSDLSSQIPDFISLAELRLNRNLRTRQMIETTDLSVTAGTPTVTIPSDFLEIKDIYIDGSPRISLTYLSPSAFTRDARAHESGQPVNYTMNGTQFILAPNPDAAYTIKLMYYAKPDALTDSNLTNVYTDNYMDVLLYGSLIEAEPYLMNDARAQVWGTLYNNGIQAINDSDQASEYSGVPLTMSVTSR